MTTTNMVSCGSPQWLLIFSTTLAQKYKIWRLKLPNGLNSSWILILLLSRACQGRWKRIFLTKRQSWKTVRKNRNQVAAHAQKLVTVPLSTKTLNWETFIKIVILRHFLLLHKTSSHSAELSAPYRPVRSFSTFGNERSSLTAQHGGLETFSSGLEVAWKAVVSRVFPAAFPRLFVTQQRLRNGGRLVHKVMKNE